MTFVDLQVPAITNYRGIVCADSDPNWALDSLLSELNSIEEKLRATSPYPSQLKLGSFASPTPPPPVTSAPADKLEQYRDGSKEEEPHSAWSKPFVMRVPFGEGDDSDSESSQSGSDENSDREFARMGTRFSCVDVDLSESEGSGDESDVETAHANLMRKTSLEEGILHELERENQLRIKEEVRKRVSRLEAELRNEYEKAAATIMQIEKRAEVRREMDRRLDKQYQRKIAEELDYHLAIIQRNHEQRSQAEELRIRNDAALEDAKRKEKALLEEKMRQEKAKADAEARVEAARIAERAQKATLEASRKASKEETENDNARTSTGVNNNVVKKDVAEQKQAIDVKNTGDTKKGETPDKMAPDRKKDMKSTGVIVRAADSAIKEEGNRAEKYIKVAEQNAQLGLNFSKEYETCARQISKRIRQITGTVENVRAKANELVSIINDPRFPRSLSVVAFAQKVVELCENPSGTFEGTVFAFGHVIVLVVSQVPGLMDLILAEFHKVCIYTVPKYIQASETAGRTCDYWKMVGYREENGKMESSECYLGRMENYMKLYAALVQTEIPGIQNPHGLKEGWAWIARFLNELPVTASSATALHAFLKMAGYALLRKYKVQFKKILNVISSSYLPALKAQQHLNLAPIISKLELYISNREFMKEPEGWRLRTHLSSREFF